MLKYFIIFLIILGLGSFFYQYLTQPVEPADEISVLLGNLKQETGIAFSEAEEAEFEWYIETAKGVMGEKVLGKGFEAVDVLSEQLDRVHPFFIDNGFQTDVYNFAAGTISELRGYIKDKTVCIIASGLTGYREAEGQWLPPETNQWEVLVKCGQLFNKEQACLDSGGQVTESTCCETTTDFPNLCLLGPCGCSLENSHQVKICDCGEGKCFNGQACVEFPLE